MLNKIKLLKNYKLNCIDGEIGKVKDFYFDDQSWTIKYLIVNTGNWLSHRQVLVSPHAILSIDNEEEYIAINLTKDKIEKSPILESDKPVSEQYHKVYSGYYGYPLNTGLVGYMGMGNNLPLAPIEVRKEQYIRKAKEEEVWDSHLRSTHAVSGYDIQTLDERIGHVSDFIIDIETWKIQYLEIDTKKWLAGRNILISPNWIERITWDDSLVYVNLGSDEIEKAPEYTDKSILDRDFETRLHKHYNQKAYWLD